MFQRKTRTNYVECETDDKVPFRLVYLCTFTIILLLLKVGSSARSVQYAFRTLKKRQRTHHCDTDLNGNVCLYSFHFQFKNIFVIIFVRREFM